MVALPAVLVLKNCSVPIVGDGGAAGRAGVEELHELPLLVMVALPAVLRVEESQSASLLVMVALPAVLVS